MTMVPTTARCRIPPPRGVDLWAAPLDQPASSQARLIASCSAIERARAARMPIARRRRDFLVGRGVVRSVLGAYLGIPPGHVKIAAGAHGKPFVDSSAAPSFSVSHSHGLAVIAVTAGFEVGVDLELVDPRLDVAAIARQFLSTEEAARLSQLGPVARLTAFLRLWTRKEAYAKARGTGFAVGIGEALSSPTRSASRMSDPTRTIVDTDPAPGYIGALAYEGPPAPLHTPSRASASL
jgi:4'-phosphopantetheinyl transferase